ncbi:hypothetical protein IGI04_034182 [Brassica rapa subsp. trilocularis]|uniref:Uncharacterized protein n=1 Tax=Brassica rapa subsp. trilocularis TaxID=1813537 RepID=A0ABQ7L7Z6_BRACM|nr:hypothetical protein IGI04_034182 [Brassica rapa subsp. trilocularis]
MWYIWKNNKLFRGIDKDPLETVRHVESEYHTWFEANIRQEQEIARFFHMDMYYIDCSIPVLFSRPPQV